MSSSSQRGVRNPKPSAAARGRSVKQKRPFPVFYAILGVIAVLGVATIAYLALRPSGGGTTVAGPAPSLDSFPAKGKADAPVTVVEYSDFQCPACGFYASQMENLFDQKYVDTGKVRFIYHDFPLRQHRNAIPAAEAARAAKAQGKFWEMHDLLFKQQYEWQDLPDPTAQFVKYAQAIGLDTAKFQQALKDGTYRSEILAAQKAGEDVGIPATPTFVIDGKQYNMNQLDQAVDQALSAKQK